MIEFRKLRADEIDVRVGKVFKDNKGNVRGITLLLYKDARVDMDILDETVGPVNWMRDHKELKGVVYCGVGLRASWPDEGVHEWIWKWDAGAESYTEKEKGEASDSFKRACVCVGIGRELYTAPLIWIDTSKVKIVSGKVKDRFKVRYIDYEGKAINCLVIENDRKEIVFSYGTPSKVNNDAG